MILLNRRSYDSRCDAQLLIIKQYILRCIGCLGFALKLLSFGPLNLTVQLSKPSKVGSKVHDQFE